MTPLLLKNLPSIFVAVTFVMMLSKLLRFIMSIYLNVLITGASLYPMITILIRSWLVESYWTYTVVKHLIFLD